ncbi:MULTISPECIES: ABC transporter permease [unclassified Microbacterium]|jgi:peptide/nickel transport system permease protein|uniref:ABC transporter permease n=1 Tax=unclassified Microbacterium TaxID=2609290 RepID=UPI000CFD60ED|nr:MULTISPECIES: ABC transporter permease [unclassified Microbacterium]PQZ57494.1 peptide ABC transporter permease [Microbacterium sp. MYb43]PQZ77296.1 peptide ABC transporter permease [Microbacterium sp. MYb40]PRB22709.1 peptide ABC transporter permease [Microbacterium sp. MYb54]PRB28949.1 peptide ABC transporter permease [Microbacterium sp. MYb50]PRB68975.1 peptide ABC transporter permease [Microbacterium sp. MYb24]
MASTTATQAILIRSARSDNPWVSFLVRRGGQFVLSVWVLVTAAFLMIHLVPGDPVRAALGLNAPAELVEARRAALGLDQPLIVQYFRYIGGLFTGDMGTSMITSQPVSEIIATRLPATLQLALLAVVLVLLVAVPLGVTMAVATRGGRRRGLELAFATGSVILAAIPEFLLAVGLVYVFAVSLGWFPVAGNTAPLSLVLPVLALAVGPIAVFSRIIRVEVLSVLGQDFIRTARAKRLAPHRIYSRHALPNAMTATLTLTGLLLTGMVAGTVLVENVFAWPGLGTMIVQSILTKDYSVVQGIVLVYGVGVLVVNLVIDVILALLDPRSTIREA